VIPLAILAIDVSKNYLSFFSDFIGSGTVENSPQGIVELFNKAFASSSDFSLVLESTGVFSFNVANFFFQNNVPVFWVKLITLSSIAKFSIVLKLTKSMLNLFLYRF